MSDLSAERQRRWQQIVEQLDRDYRSLPQTEKEHIAELLTEIKCAQQPLDHLFKKADGELVCAACEGACCAKGHNHAGLANVLAYLQQDTLPPQPDFSVTCPWLGPRGCAHDADRRPYNCISFLCDKLEERLDKAEVEEFYRLDRELRKWYQVFSDRYLGGGMTGLLLQSERQNGRSLLGLRSATTDETVPQESA